MTEKIFRISLVIMSLVTVLSIRAQIDSHLTYRCYTTQDGLPQLQTERLWQDSRGYIYIGTLSGFVRYDGREFTPFLKGRRENIVGFAECNGKVRALGFRRQWLIEWDELEMKPVDDKGQLLLNNLNSGDLPNGLVVLENENEQHRRLCRITERGLDTIMSPAVLDRMTLQPENKRLSFRTVNGLVNVETSDIAFLKADGNYTTLVTFQGRETIFTGIGVLAKTLDSSVFVRADRSTLVNLHNISRLNFKKRTCTFRSSDGRELETSLLVPAFKRLEELMR